MLPMLMTVTLNTPHPPLPNHYNTDKNLMYVTITFTLFNTLRPKMYVVLI